MYMFLIVLMSFSILLFGLQSQRRLQCIQFACDDSDMKIAPDKFGYVNQGNESANKDANLYFIHKQNGNIFKAHQMGEELAKTVTEFRGTKNIENYEFINFQAKALVAFAAEQCIRECSPDTILAKSSQTVFYEEIKRFSPHVYDFIINSGSYSMYMLCLNGSNDYALCVGQSFAKACQRPDDEQFIKMGYEIYKNVSNTCVSKYSAIGFTKI